MSAPPAENSGVGGENRSRQAAGCTQGGSTALTGVKAQVAGVEALHEQTRAQLDALEMAVAPVQEHQENVTQIKL